VVVKLKSLISGEYAENEFRKDFTPSERAAIGKAIEKELGDRKPGPKCGPIGPQLPSDRTADIAAPRSGFTDRKTFERAKTVVERDAPELIAAMDTGEVLIDAAAKIARQPKAD
jgi:ParB family chromosome partitioning protein